MRQGLLVVSVAVLGVMTIAAQTREGWTLVWADEFERDGLPDPSKWTYEKGFVRNKEAQYYTVKRAENARVEGGRLIIEGHKEEYTAPDGKRASYTAASVTTDGTFALTYGRVEVKAKLPRGRGMWPAIWMLGTSIHDIGWPRCGEIDIMEFVGHEPSAVHANVHWFDAAKGKLTSAGGKLHEQNPSDGFHIYAVEWFKDRMDFFYDERLYFSCPLTQAGTDEANPFHKPHYLILNLAIGGSWGGQQGIDDSIFPQRYEIDYVRFYQKK
ncbi:MAG TPA: glycoside hydrolase family 16 protein [Kiritimatiellia bacterium]|nr:glycoside hydrolase family 16 protein [Kiritimatiellia bacterium]HRU70707.1 glycoside hydrolase family 16 protein [Kiritimatiellia bacterium]